MTTKHEVIALHKARPDITARQAADHLGCGQHYVIATCRREGIKFALKERAIPDAIRRKVISLERKVLL